MSGSAHAVGKQNTALKYRNGGLTGVIGIRDAAFRTLIACALILSDKQRGKTMNRYFTIGLAMLAGVGLGAAAMRDFMPRASHSSYLVTEIDVTNVDAYVKEYAPLAQASIRKAGGKLLAASLKVSQIEGTHRSELRFRFGIASIKYKLGGTAPIIKTLGKLATSMRLSAPMPSRECRNNGRD